MFAFLKESLDSRLKRESKDEVCLLGTGVSSHLGEHWDAKRIGYFNILCSFECQVGDGKAIGTIETGGVRHSTYGGAPIYCGYFEGHAQLYVRAVGTLTILVHTVVTREVGKPLDAGGTKVVTDVGLEDMVGAMGIVLKVATLRIQSGVEPVVGQADVETTCSVGQCFPML